MQQEVGFYEAGTVDWSWTEVAQCEEVIIIIFFTIQSCC